MIPARDYTTVSDMLEGYAGIRQRLFAIPKPPILRLAPVVVVQPEPIEPLWMREDTEFDHHVKLMRAAQHWGVHDYLKKRCEELGASYLRVVKGAERWRHIVHARQQLMWEIRTVYGFSFPQIGKVFGKDHTTAIHAFNKIELERARADK